jgi:hypothetical protein
MGQQLMKPRFTVHKFDEPRVTVEGSGNRMNREW